MSPLQRLELSEQVISGWEAVGWPSGPIAGNLRLIADELAKLLEIAEEQPNLNRRVDAVAHRYALMAEKLKVGLN